MKRFALYFGIASALVASCSTQEKDFQTPQHEDVIYYASFEQPAEKGTRVYTNEDLLLRWTADDRVSIFGMNTLNQQYRFMGETGDNAGGFSKVEGAEYVTGNPISHTVSVYPYQASTKISEDEVVTVTLPAEQSYAENTFGLGANTMVSVSEDNFLQYKNVGGYLRLSLYGEGVTVSSITLKGNNGEKLAGKASVTMPLGSVPTVEMASDAVSEITLVCDTPVVLGSTEAESKDFWFVVPPTTFSRGFTVSVSQISGIVYEKSMTKGIDIERSKLSKMSPLKVKGDYPVPEAVDLGLPSGLKWASFNLGASAPEEYGDYYAWGETQPKDQYDWSTYKWCMGTEWSMTMYCSNSQYGYNGFTDTNTVLDSKDDAAHVNLGGSWRMPTEAEFSELLDNCDWGWISMNGIIGRKVTGPNGNSIFLPVAGSRDYKYTYGSGYCGNYWSSSLDRSIPEYAQSVSFNSEKVYWLADFRNQGLSVRPVYGDLVSVESVSLNKSSLDIELGSETKLMATVLPANAADKSVSWCSSNESIATVSSTGVVTGIAVGSAIITVTSNDGGKTASCNVTVSEASVQVLVAVDLGLPSGLKWASFNLGASKPEEYGDYYAWGETQPKDNYNWSTYKWCLGSNSSITKYCSNPTYGHYGFADAKTLLDLEDDAAYVNLEGNWRMPTDSEWTELRDHCSWEWTSMNGINGQKVTGPNGNGIFLPAAGNRYETSFYNTNSCGLYWSSSLKVYHPDLAVIVNFSSAKVFGDYVDRFYGFSIRPVYAE